jgi:hypothetical protein
MEVGGKLYTLATLPPGKTPVPIAQKARWSQGWCGQA